MLGQYFWRDVQSYFSQLISAGWPVILAMFALGLLVHWLDYRRNKVCRIWPVLAALGLYLVTFVILLFRYTMSTHYFSISLGSYSLGFALGWFLMELVLRCRKKGNP